MACSMLYARLLHQPASGARSLFTEPDTGGDLGSRAGSDSAEMAGEAKGMDVKLSVRRHIYCKHELFFNYIIIRHKIIIIKV